MRSIRPISMTAALLLATQLLTGCASAHNPDDPLEPFNRGVYRFNDSMDRAVVKPVAQGYDTVMPELGKIAINNSSPISTTCWSPPTTCCNSVRQAASDGARVPDQHHLGLGGLVNVAHRLEKHNEDFGQTLGYWVWAAAPIWYCPSRAKLGARRHRALRGHLGRHAKPDRRHRHPQPILCGQFHPRARKPAGPGELLDEAALDRYAFMRESYMMYRKNLVYDGNPPRAELR